MLQRYIWVVGAKPWDVTEILANQNSTEPNLESRSRSEVSEQDKHFLVAVTLLWECQIVFMDLSKKTCIVAQSYPYRGTKFGYRVL